jgi:HPt (histidine-containing phosphotransfer) domain-containing protein
MQVPTELKTMYLNRRIQDISKIKSGLKSGDFGLAEKLGHQVKGNAETFEFPEMANLGLEIEKAAIKKDPSLVMSLVDQMEMAIHEAQGKLSH